MNTVILNPQRKVSNSSNNWEVTCKDFWNSPCHRTILWNSKCKVIKKSSLTLTHTNLVIIFVNCDLLRCHAVPFGRWVAEFLWSLLPAYSRCMCHVLSHLATQQEHGFIMGHFLTPESHQMSMSWRKRCLYSLNTALLSHSTSVLKTEVADCPDVLLFFYRTILPKQLRRPYFNVHHCDNLKSVNIFLI
jgi:hypothetical protein